MKNMRSVPVIFVVVACFFLCGFKKPIHNRDTLGHKQQTLTVVKPPKVLDLELPYQDAQGVEEVVIQGQPNPLAVSFSQEKKKKFSALELKGKVIMSQDPAIEKIRSADGAAIEINLHH